MAFSKILTLFSVTLSLVLLMGAAARGQSTLDGFDPNANQPIHAMAVQADGKILIGGDFSTLSPNGGSAVTRSHIARLNPDGTVDTAFDPNASNSVDVIVVQPNGKILIGGDFTTLSPNGGVAVTRNHLARLNPDGTLDAGFNPNASASGSKINAVAVQADGKILVGGVFTSIGGQTRNNIARLDATTGLVDSFNPNANGPGVNIYAITLQTDGKILVGGRFLAMGGQTRNSIARLDPTTGLADSFNPNSNNDINAIVLQADGKIVVGGAFAFIGGQTRNNIARLDPATGLADSFDPNANTDVDAIGLQTDGKIVVGGRFSIVGGQTRSNIARLDPVTGLADSFNPTANSDVISIAVQADGKVLVAGFFTGLGGIEHLRNRIARLEVDGRLDQSLGVSMLGVDVAATTVQPDGKILVGGNFTSILGFARNNIARLNTDGTLDSAFDPNADNAVESLVLQADGKILVGGSFSAIGGQMRSFMARLDPTSGLADSFDPSADGVVNSIAVQSDGLILVGGDFTFIGGQARNFIARLDATSGQADSFDPAANAEVLSIALQADGKILTGGAFTSIGGQPRTRIARLNPSNGHADNFSPDANNSVESIAVQSDGKILAGGRFISIGGQSRTRIARLDPTTGNADSFNPSANNSVETLALQSDGKILAGGVFTSIGGQARSRIARLDPTTGLADSFNPNANNDVLSIAVAADGKILVGGYFTTIGGGTNDFLERLTNDGAALQNLAVTQTTITWTLSGTGPQFTRVTFESSNDNVNYTLLGSGTLAGSSWTLTGLSLPLGQNIFIRARGYHRNSHHNGSGSITESVRNAFLSGATPTPTATPVPTCPPVITQSRTRTSRWVIRPRATMERPITTTVIGERLT